MKHKDDFYPFALCPALSAPVSTSISNPNELFERRRTNNSLLFATTDAPSRKGLSFRIFRATLRQLIRSYSTAASHSGVPKFPCSGFDSESGVAATITPLRITTRRICCEKSVVKNETFTVGPN